jgi:hypothetical protein
MRKLREFSREKTLAKVNINVSTLVPEDFYS